MPLRKVSASTSPSSPHAMSNGQGNRLQLPGGSTVPYLWVLVGIELVATLALRTWSAGHHGG